MVTKHQQQMDRNQIPLEGREQRTIEFLNRKRKKDMEYLKNILQQRVQ